MHAHMERTLEPSRKPTVAILQPRARGASRFAGVFDAFASLGAVAVAAPYHDDDREAVRRQLLAADGVLVWVNPIEDGHDRSVLDALLREVSSAGVFVSAHPDLILKIGTKDVLYTTRSLGWGCDTHLYRSVRQLREELPARLDTGPRVLKQYRGHSGDGVWKVEAAPDGLVRVRHAKRGAMEESLRLEALVERMAQYFDAGPMLDQAWQPRLAEGTVRCYLVQDRVEGFGHQAINALHPTEPVPGPRLYHPSSKPEFQLLKQRLEDEWLPAMQRLLGIATDAFPILWDCDFLLGPKDSAGNDGYVLCEINVSSVSPFPESALEPLARATLRRLGG
jgi:hypothetical protein